MNEVKEVKLNVTPVNGQVLIKKEILDYPLLAINNNSQPREVGAVNITMAKSTIEGYKVGDKLILAKDCPMIKIFDIENPHEYLTIQSTLKGLNNKETEELMKTTTSFTIVEYLLINHRDILATVG